MANVLNRTTLDYRRSVHTPDFDPAEWVIHPDMSAVEGVDRKYWKLDGERPVPMTADEQAAVDAAQAAAELTARRQAAVAAMGSPDPLAMAVRVALKHTHTPVALKPGKPDRPWADVVADIAGQIMAGEGD